MKLLVFLLLQISLTASGQFFVAEKEPVSPSLVLLDQYQPMSANGFSNWKNEWDPKNLYTRVIAIRDNQGRLFHILYQERFDGTLSFFSYSKNLVRIFERADKPMVQFHQCLKQHAGMFKPLHEVSVVIECFMQRLALCAE